MQLAWQCFGVNQARNNYPLEKGIIVKPMMWPFVHQLGTAPSLQQVKHLLLGATIMGMSIYLLKLSFGLARSLLPQVSVRQPNEQ